MRKQKPFYLHFRLRPDRNSAYRQFYCRLRVGKAKPVDYGVGVYAESGQWKPYRNRGYYGDTFRPNQAIESKLEAVYEQHCRIFEDQLRVSRLEGWEITASTIKRQFRGLSPILKVEPIAPCRIQWKVIQGYLSTPKTTLRYA